MSKLSEYLAGARKQAGLSLRAAEATTGISNAYLSQLENGKIQEPSPVLLGKLAQLYHADYLMILDLAGYPVPRAQRPSGSRLAARLGPTNQEEEEALVEYLEFLRSKRKGGGRK
jgi:transcriptional regulator with XRE-family HTH domain